jgi:hypothetical protein
MRTPNTDPKQALFKVWSLKPEYFIGESLMHRYGT